MKIVFIAPHFQVLSRQSDSNLLWPLLRELAPLNKEVLVVASKSVTGREYIERDRVKVYFLNQSLSEPTEETYTTALELFLIESHQKQPIDVVHIVEGIDFSFEALKKKLKFKVILDVDALGLSQLFSILSFNKETALSYMSIGFKAFLHFIFSYLTKDRELLKRADGVLVSSPQQRFYLERYYMYPDSRIFIVPRAFSLQTEDSSLTPPLHSPGSLTSPVTSASPVMLANPVILSSLVGSVSSRASAFSEFLEKISLEPKAQLILNVTDMSHAIETIHLLKAFERLAVKRSSCYLVIVGEGPSYGEIEFQLYNLALGERVFLLGPQPSEVISHLILKATLFVDLSSVYRQFESYAIESMLRKRLVIASELGPLAHIIEDGMDGFLVRPGDFTQLQRLFLKILEGRLEIESLIEAGYNKASHVFSPGRAVDVMQLVYHETQKREFKL
jgi:1,2-diacylglycerol 3-alpha-glucosyltransferase